MSERSEWLKRRRLGIGSSDAPIVMNVSPWSTPLKLYNEKISTNEPEEDDSNGYAKNMGNMVEPKVRSLYEFSVDRNYPPMEVVNDECSFLRASLDGGHQLPDGSFHSIIEIKLSGKEDFENSLKDIVPEKYMPQIQHQLMVTGAPVCYYLSYFYERGEMNSIEYQNLAIVEVYPDIEYQKTLLAAEMDFWNNHVLKRVPPNPSDKDFVTLKGQAKLVNKWKSLVSKAAIIESEIKEIEEELKKLATESGHPRVKCAGVKLSLVIRQGNVDYKKVPEIKGLDLEQYRAKSSSYWKLSLDKEKE